MAGIKISQLTPGGPIQVADEIPIARAGVETYKILANQIVTDGVNIGTGPGQLFADKIIPSSTALRFRTLSADQGLTITTSDTTINISTSGQNPIKTTFFGNASAISFPINGNFSKNTNNYRVDINGVLQEPIADYTVVGSNIIFTTPPPLNSKVVVVANNLVTINETIPADNSVTTQKIALTAVTQDKIAPITATGTLSARSLQDRFADAINVKDFGAVGDGVTDDFDAFVVAIATANAFNVPLKLEAKTYRLRTQLDILSSVYIEGVGRNTILFFDAGNINGVWVKPTAPNTVIKNLQILGAPSYATLGTGIIIESNFTTLENLFVTRFSGHGILGVPPSGTELLSPIITKCYVFDVGFIGCSLIKTVGGLVDGCKFQKTGLEGFTFDTGPWLGTPPATDGTDLSHCVNCWFDDNCNNGGVGAAGCDGSTGIIFANNIVVNCADPSVGQPLSDAGLFGAGFTAQNNLVNSNYGIIANNYFVNCRRGVYLKGRNTPTSAIENLSAGGAGKCFETTGFKVYGNTYSGITLPFETFRDDNPPGFNSYEAGLVNFSAFLNQNQTINLTSSNITPIKLQLNTFKNSQFATLTDSSIAIPLGGIYNLNGSVRIEGLSAANCNWASLIISNSAANVGEVIINIYNVDTNTGQFVPNILEFNISTTQMLSSGTISLYFRAFATNTATVTAIEGAQRGLNGVLMN